MPLGVIQVTYNKNEQSIVGKEYVIDQTKPNTATD
jgi:hypothetical protein